MPAAAPEQPGTAATGRAGQAGFARWKARVSPISVVSVAVVLAAWALCTQTGLVGAIPSPLVIAGTFSGLVQHGYSGHPLWQHVLYSILRCLTGLVSGVFFGVLIGLSMGLNRNVNDALSPFFSFLRPIPLIAFIPLFVAYFGIGEFPKVLVIFLAAFWFVVLSAANGVKTVPQDWIRAAENVGLHGWRLLIEVILPASLPSIMTGIKTATAISWAVVVTAELIAAQVGLGYMIEDAATFFNLPVVYIGIMIIGIIGVCMEIAINRIERRVLHWAGR